MEKIICRNYEILNGKLEKEFADLSINPDKAADKEPLISLKWPLYYLSCFDPNSNIKKLSSDDNSHQSYFSSKEEAKNYCVENFFRLLGVSKSYSLALTLHKELIIKIFDECNFVFTTSRNYCSDLKKAEQLAIDNAAQLTSEFHTSTPNNHDITDVTNEVGLSGLNGESDS